VTDTPATIPVVGRPGEAYAAAHLRWAGVADAASLAELWRAAYPEEDASDMAAWLEHGGALTLQDRSGRLLAALRWREEADGWRVDRVASRPEERGQGFGRWLATKVEALAIRQNVPYLLLDLPADDAAQLAYYRRMGYRDEPGEPDARGRLTLRKPVGGVWQRKSTGGTEPARGHDPAANAPRTS